MFRCRHCIQNLWTQRPYAPIKSHTRSCQPNIGGELICTPRTQDRFQFHPCIGWSLSIRITVPGLILLLLSGAALIVHSNPVLSHPHPRDQGLSCSLYGFGTKPQKFTMTLKRSWQVFLRLRRPLIFSLRSYLRSTVSGCNVSHSSCDPALD